MIWISVIDRLPDYAQDVLIIRFNKGRFYFPDIASYYGGEFFPTYDLPNDVDFKADCITHWMPLPEPPTI